MRFKPLSQIRQVHPGIHAFTLFSEAECAAILREVDRKRDGREEAPNSMNKYGADLSEIGMQRLANALARDVVAPLAAGLYPDVGPLKKPYGFLVDYSHKQRSLNPHIDEPSAVTLNVCLGRDFEGGRLVFKGLRCGRHDAVRYRPDEHFEVEHVIGRAILHRGHHLHQARPIDHGRRTNLILWCGAKIKSRKHPVWCNAVSAQSLCA